MKRCPQCERFGVEYNSIGKEQCIWRDCLWLNKDNINLDEYKFGIKFKKFINAVTKKEQL